MSDEPRLELRTGTQRTFFMALLDAHGLSLVPVPAWGLLWGAQSTGRDRRGSGCARDRRLVRHRP